MKTVRVIAFLLLLLLCGCMRVVEVSEETETETPTIVMPAVTETPTAVPVIPRDGSLTEKRPKYMPEELVEYTCLSGDTLPALAARFNTTEEQIRAANPVLPRHVTTLPQGLPLQIPIYYRSSWGSSWLMIPDSLIVDGPEQTGFSARSFTDRQPGWFKYYSTYTDNKNLRGGEVVEHIADNYSVSPRLLLALFEYITHGLTDDKYPDDINTASVFGFEGVNSKTLSSQFNKLADFLNDVFYSYLEGRFFEYELQDGSLVRIDPWVNAGTAALEAYFAKVLSPNAYRAAIGPDGFVRTYKDLFGDFPPVSEYPENIPGSLEQIELGLPFQEGEYWTLTGGPHTGYGNGRTYSAVDFAPPANEHGCFLSQDWVTAPADGIIVRTGIGTALLDLDGDGNEHTGWVLLFLHLKTESIPPVGTVMKKGDRMGHPSCDGGTSSGTHVHVARKYNGEWMAAGGVIPLNMDNWIAADGEAPYLGTMTRFSSSVTASTASEYYSQIYAGAPVFPTQVPNR